MSGERRSRRAFMTATVGAAFAPLAVPRARAATSSPAGAAEALRALQGRVVKNGRLKQSVSRWPYNAIPLPDFCKAIADMGLEAIDLLEEPDWAVARDHGLTTSMAYAGGGSIRDGLNVTANHDASDGKICFSRHSESELATPSFAPKACAIVLQRSLRPAHGVPRLDSLWN